MTDAEYLKSIRKKLHLSQTEFANRLGYAHQETVSDKETGKTPISPQVLAHLRTIEKHEL